MIKTNSNKVTKNFLNLDTKTLIELLKNDLYHSEESILNENDIFTIMEILSDRGHFDNNLDTEDNMNIDDSWNSFIKEYIPNAHNPQNHSFFDVTKKRIAAIIICIIISSGFFLNTTVAKDLFSSLASWSDEFFQFDNSNDNNFNVSNDS